MAHKTLAEMQQLAARHGGRCLSREYTNLSTELRWRCDRGHTWSKRPSRVIAGTWCPECARRERASRGLTEMREVARARGGRCRARRFERVSDRYEWRCAQGHVWMATWQSVRAGHWCARCAGHTPFTLDDLREIAAQKGGTLVSRRYTPGAKVRWRCAQGHTWQANPTQVKRTSWCPTCARKTRYSLEDMRALARVRGGECLSVGYRTVIDKLRWRCAEGHEWEATANSILSGTWCRACLGIGVGSIDQMGELARQRGGRCLSRSYATKMTKLRWRCGEGHEWEATPAAVERGVWCPFCQRRGIRGIQDFFYEQLVQAAERRGGEVLSPEYIDVETPMRFRCQLGHEWVTKPTQVHRGSWCPECAHSKRPKLKTFQQLARKRGGRCLSDRYTKGTTPLELECARGHRFEMLPRSIRGGGWCPECARGKKRKRGRVDLESLSALARERGGECLSTEYKGLRTKLAWRCRYGHTWEALPVSIRKGSWCDVCLGRVPLTIDDMRASAANRGGRCLSRTYEGTSKKLAWRCAAGHRFEAAPQHIRAGSWCPVCFEPTPDAGIERVTRFARGRGGVCLASRHHDPSMRLRWRCGQGHTWRATEADAIARWCPLCL